MIEVQGLGKQYFVRQRDRMYYSTLRDRLSGIKAPEKLLRKGRKPFWALTDVDFQVRQGEIVGFVGRNGAGKSTLLKILARVTEPTTGRARMYGRVGSMLEVGTGFHPELTGMENIYLNGAILGMKKNEIDRKLDEIIAFSGVQEFIHNPIKFYSSGMSVRLAFSVAAHLEPEILLIDEVLAVGDAAFQEKCINKMGDVAQSGRTILFVSHNMAAVENLCSRVFVMENGKIVDEGSPRHSIATYLASVRSGEVVSLSDRTDRQGNGAVRIEQIEFLNAPGGNVSCGQDLDLVFHYTATGSTQNGFELFATFRTIFGEVLCAFGTDMAGLDTRNLPATGKIHCRIKRFPLIPGYYSFSYRANVLGITADGLRDALEINVVAGDFYGTGRLPNENLHAKFLVEQEWHIL